MDSLDKYLAELRAHFDEHYDIDPRDVGCLLAIIEAQAKVVEAAAFMRTHEACMNSEPADIGRLRDAFAVHDERVKEVLSDE